MKIRESREIQGVLRTQHGFRGSQVDSRGPQEHFKGPQWIQGVLR